MTNTMTLKEINAAIEDGGIDFADAHEVLTTRLERAKDGSYKARRYAIALADLEENGTIDVKASFEGAKAEVAAKPKASKPKAKASKAKAKKSEPAETPLAQAAAAFVAKPTAAGLVALAAFVK
tara:strand:+ start:218 stop:589 length:372 start_codon:yes stop_codon:yes gene_type:complete